MKYKLKQLFRIDISKIYILGVACICLLLVGAYFSYAMFTVTKEKDKAINIVTGGLDYRLEVDGVEGNTLTVPEKTTSTFMVTLSNPNNRVARFNFYYEGDLPSGVTVGYEVSDGVNVPPEAKGTNLSKADSAGSSNTYLIKISNSSNSSVTINLGVGVGLDYNDLELPANGHLFEEMQYKTVSETLLTSNLGNGSTYDDGTDTFITGTDPNNYIWYSGKLWRAVSVNKKAGTTTGTTKLVTQWNISAITYSSGSTDFEGSYMEDWLNDTSVDGFLGNLRDYENFIVTDATWDATLDATSLGSITRPNGTTTVTDAVGLLNMYEYQSSYHGTNYSNGYLNNGLYWWTLTPYSSSRVRNVSDNGNAGASNLSYENGVRPSINLKSSIKIVDGDGTVDNPYRLNGDNDTNLSGTLLSSRYSGEYIRFGSGENNLYRIVSHEAPGLTKITSTEPLKSSGSFMTSEFGSNTTYSSTNTLGTFLNNDYLNIGNGYLTNEDIAMIEDSTTWYIGTVGSGTSYKLAKYTDTNMSGYATSTDAKVGLLRMGELMAGQFDRNDNNTIYWTLTPYSSSYVRIVIYYGSASNYSPSSTYGVRPSVNLKSNVQITGGTGTKNDPFTIELES